MTNKKLAASAEPMTQKYSFKGYKFKAFLMGNKEALKLVIAAILAFAAYGVNIVSNPTLNGLTSALVAAGTKFTLDAIDFWLKE